MSAHTETVKTIQGRLDILEKSLVSEENSVQYYQTLLEKTPEDSEENLGARRMYEDLREEEKTHVQAIRNFIAHWEKKLEEIPSA
ncbi:MAG: hypothetical protein IIA62_10970 [Nitrospinae bacterium]|nr:hypothetical protein [Nitrospinota bacterium]